MSKFTEGTRVVVNNFGIRYGVIDRLYNDLKIAIVKFDDGNVEKVHFSDLDIEPETKVQEKQEVKAESQEGAKVITKDQFMEALDYVTSPEGMLGDKVVEIDPMSLMLKSMAISIVGLTIKDTLFQDKEEIEITKEQLKDVITEKTNPVEVLKTVDNKMTIGQIFPIAMLSMLVLSKLTRVLFDEGEND